MLQYWLTPADLESPESQRLRDRFRLVRGHDVDDADTPPTDEWVEERITIWLDAFDAGDPAGFWQACCLVYLRPGASHFLLSDELDPDLTAQPRWSTLPGPVRERFLAAVKPYLDQARCDPDA